MSEQRQQTTRPAPDEIEPGIPATSEQPRAVPEGWEAEEEAPPLDVPQGVEEWGTTAREEAIGESVAMRSRREEPEVWERAPAPDQEAGVSVLEPGPDGGLTDTEPDAIGELEVDREYTVGAEEAAMRVEEEPAGLTYDRGPGYLDDE
ncbi:MAG TPA: hypothetical protein VM390_12865 [Acidimicrobiales bacterium]|jgi:hypothetical protein|nr:hypothetical protein [Acidimicrobiales bacterium]